MLHRPSVTTSYLTIYRHLLDCHGPQHWWPGDSPFEIMVGAVLTQNTAWTNVEKAICKLKAAAALEPRKLARLPQARLARLLTPAGYFNVKARRLQNFCRWYLEQGGYEALRHWNTPRLRRGLLSVNGVGPETADDILLYAFQRPVFVIDAYTRRIFSRLGRVAQDLSYEALRETFEHSLRAELGRCTKRRLARLFNEYHALIVVHGKDVCRPRPRCGDCCLRRLCAAHEA